MNINDYVYVRLTKLGVDTLVESWAGSDYPIVSSRELGGGWFKFQLHDLMHTFGPKTFIGQPNMFVRNEVLFEDPTLPLQESEKP